MTSERDTKSGFSAEERAAMKQRSAELKAQKGGGSKSAKAERDRQACLDAIAALPDDERAMAERIHAIVTEVAPHLQPKTWYGFPSYARDGKIVVFFSPASKFKTRYSSLGFEEAAQLDDGDMWPVGFALTKVTDAEAARITELVKRAAG
ncbi:MAG TPA: DUF1801 domain-containing protein [Microbacterium sp.]|nr:DUF1801 domain-containing protein [Microbacterium sp.]